MKEGETMEGETKKRNRVIFFLSFPPARIGSRGTGSRGKVETKREKTNEASKPKARKRREEKGEETEEGIRRRGRRRRGGDAGGEETQEGRRRRRVGDEKQNECGRKWRKG